MKTRALAVIVVAAGCAAVGLVHPAGAQTPPEIPHTVEGRDACLACHGPGGGAPTRPADHEGRTNDMCRLCHQPGAVAAAPSRAPEVAAPPERGAGTPEFRPPAILPERVPLREGRTRSCYWCHSSYGGRLEQIARDWEASIHAERGIGCEFCHGGNPNAATADEAMSGASGWAGVPSRERIPDLCGSCHANVAYMRQFNLPTDQLARYRESEHAKLLARGDDKVAVCTDCHGGHRILAPDDPASTVYTTNVPQTCARCHANPEYMRGYGIPTHQYALYRESVHGKALLERKDRRAPTCATCHGTHGAAPPGFAEVANVCGNCHGATERYYLAGAHGRGEEGSGVPRCITCHGRYDVGPASDALFAGDEPGRCTTCHAGGPIREKVDSIAGAITLAARRLDEASARLDEAEALNLIVRPERERLREALTALIEARAVQHTADAAEVREKTEASVQISDAVQASGSAMIADMQFRQKAMAVVVGFLTLLAGLVLYTKLQYDRGLRAALRKQRG
ncbi:MAG: cytochrome c3 family protein [Gemmatimonadetes bacterium]|nr:cytochrome c3 family protein [Gemmatimonadota bacterium]